ncbi:hypothetical protein CCAL13119_08935 [Campylobacter sp. RM13119]|uniref:hypothetical protein n=1 Tax=Campylobacter TaxID=194 RepID=UPI001473F7E7|nr:MULTISPECIES: hypothetical protein [unclassified Campylobacter]MBE3607047.1 hypothetical protein [Campylobacter sp. RM13119]
MSNSEEFKLALLNRAKSVLFNPNEITDEALSVVCHEVDEECGGRNVKTWAMMDFAIIRLKIFLKIALSEEDIVLLKSATNEIKNSPLISQTKNGSAFNYAAV